MRSKRVILIAVIVFVAATVFVLALLAVRADSRPFDDGVAFAEVAPVDDWALPEGATFVSLTELKGESSLVMLKHKGISIGVSKPWQPRGGDDWTLVDELGTLQRRDDTAGVLGSGSPWLAVRVRQDWRGISVMTGDGFASRGLRAVVSLRNDGRVHALTWNARSNVVQEIIASPKDDTELREYLDFAEQWRVPECDGDVELKAKWEAFVQRLRAQ